MRGISRLFSSFLRDAEAINRLQISVGEAAVSRAGFSSAPSAASQCVRAEQALVSGLPGSSAAASTSSALRSAGTASTSGRASGVELVQLYKQLSKHRLSALVVSTAAAGFVAGKQISCTYSGAGLELPYYHSPVENLRAQAMYGACITCSVRPVMNIHQAEAVDELSSPLLAGSGEAIDWARLGWTSLGTFACAASANALNQVYEAANDARMERTKRRPLPAGRLSRCHALLFAGLSGCAGICILATQVRTLPSLPAPLPAPQRSQSPLTSHCCPISVSLTAALAASQDKPS